MTMDSSSSNLSTVVARVPPSALPVIAGCAAFGSTLAVSTLAQLKLLGVSTGSTRPMPTVLGFVTVALASIASHGASVKTYEIAKERFPRLGSNAIRLPALPVQYTSSLAKSRGSSHRPHLHSDTMNSGASNPHYRENRDSVSIGSLQIEKQTIRICVLGLIAFKILGGRFWAISPSSYTNLGSFARFSIPATERYATPAERSTLERLGRRVGCHTCGSKMRFRKGIAFHGDHMPPKAVAQQMNNRWFRKLSGIRVQYRFFPQCIDCSAIQGSILASATNQLKSSKWWSQTPNLAGAGGGKLAHNHGARFRPYHLSGGVVAAVTVANTPDKDIHEGNPKRYRQLHEQAEEMALVAWAQIQSYIAKF